MSCQQIKLRIDIHSQISRQSQATKEKKKKDKSGLIKI